MNPDDLDIIRQIAAKNGLSGGLPIDQYGSGIANRTFSLGAYVVKLEGNLKGILAHQKETVDKLLAAGAKVPRILDSGIIGGRPYLLMEKLPGINLVYDWLKFDMKQKERFISRIADELRKFHSIRFDEYLIWVAGGMRAANLTEAIARITDFGRIKRDELEFVHKFSVELLETFYKKTYRFSMRPALRCSCIMTFTSKIFFTKMIQ